MKALVSSEVWLPLLLRTLDLLVNPTPHNILRSCEAWDYETHLRPQLRQLERARLLERHGNDRNHTLRVTEAGRLTASGGVDPVQRWQRSWDRQWRLLMFDLPSRKQSLRLRLWRWLRLSRFGYLQHSVWLSPDSVSDDTLPLRRLKLTPEAFLVIEGRPAGSDTDADLVKSAWDFAVINQRYERVCELSERGKKLAQAKPVRGNAIHRWLGEDQAAWLAAVGLDPLLPERLWPSDYLGRTAWNQRDAALAALAQSGRSGQFV